MKNEAFIMMSKITTVFVNVIIIVIMTIFVIIEYE